MDEKYEYNGWTINIIEWEIPECKNEYEIEIWPTGCDDPDEICYLYIPGQWPPIESIDEAKLYAEDHCKHTPEEAERLEKLEEEKGEL